MGKPIINFSSMETPWLVLGDFDEILRQVEKLGSRPIKLTQALRFNDMVNDCSLIDRGFTGPRFTWSNLGPT